MSKQPGGPGRSYNSTQENAYERARAGAGSVKRARQRVEAGLPLEMPESIRDTPVGGLAAVPPGRTTRLRLEPNDPPQFPSNFPFPERPVPEESTSQSAAASEKPPTTEHSRDSMPQWPLRQNDQTPRPNKSPIEERTATRGTPPQRPPRPAYVPSILDSSKRENAPLFHHQQPQHSQRPSQTQPLYWSNSFAYDPDPGPPGSSGSSSGATIPDFPPPGTLPLLSPQQIRRPPSLGPPPSSRRGGSSYYLQSSHVTPIPEEQSESATQNSHGSFASSHVIPTSWGDGPPEYYIGEDDDDVTEGEDGRLSRGTDDGESSNLVRKASMGKRHKPSLTTIRSSEGLDKDAHASNGGVAMSGLVGQAVSTPNTVGAFAAALGPTPRTSEIFEDGGEFEGGTGLLDASTSSNDSTILIPNAITTDSSVYQRPRSPVSANVDYRVREIMGGLQKGGALESGVPSPLTSTSQTSLDENTLKKLPRLNLDGSGPRESDTRGSLTSLPDLIRRATRVASNLDRGKTASKLGMLEMFNAADLSEKDRAAAELERRRSGSMSDILNAFPTPAPNTPRLAHNRTQSHWPAGFPPNSNLAIAQNTSDAGSCRSSRLKNGRRRCCGMPLWAFTLLLIILVLLIAAAIVIPVTLIVLPRQRTADAQAQAAASLSNCQKTNPCSYGINVITADSCGCICTNGFTGKTCSQTAGTDCTTMNEPTLTDATVGNAIPRLLSAAQSNFSIPLNSSTILTLFSAVNLTCNVENSLVTFNNLPQRRSMFFLEAINLSPRFEIHPREPQITPTPAASAVPTETGVFTSDGILLATSAPPSPTISTPTAQPTLPTPTPDPNLGNPNSRDLDFARVTVLYILQETASLSVAEDAQNFLQAAFYSGTWNATTVQLGNNITAGFMNMTIDLGNGINVGGIAAPSTTITTSSV
ncbi:MAG: hypothetical protein MMC33_006094 [Icmadophila ericetorum]|nr:hypothetical protein [Icmadophila ericetorum]